MKSHECIQVDKISKLDEKLDNIEKNLAILVELKEDIKANSKFRIQSKTIVGFVAFIFTAVGAMIMWTIDKIFN